MSDRHLPQNCVKLLPSSAHSWVMASGIIVEKLPQAAFIQPVLAQSLLATKEGFTKRMT